MSDPACGHANCQRPISLHYEVQEDDSPGAPFCFSRSEVAGPWAQRFLHAVTEERRLPHGFKPEQGYLAGIEGAELRRDKSQFYTPEKLALRLWLWAMHSMPKANGGFAGTVLEPAAGRGALLAPILAMASQPRMLAFDADPVNVAALRQLHTRLAPAADLEVPDACDFLAVNVPPWRSSGGQAFDLALMNPPFENNQATTFVERALLWAPKVVGIFPADMFYSAGRRPFWDRVMATRIAFLSERPQFGGDFSPATNFVVMQLEARSPQRTVPAINAPSMEWW